ncbi:MAG: hypothetical protein V4640_10080 [Verrucomicrobiota bacterium]
MTLPSIPLGHSFRAACMILSATASVQAAVITNYSLGSPQDTTIWNNLTNTNTGLAAASGSGSATLQAPGFQASVGFYSFSLDYTSTVTQTSGFDIHNVIFQVDLASNPAFPIPFSGGALLSFNGGSQNIPANWFLDSGSENRVTSFGPQTYTGAAWQWNLSAYGETITSISIVNPYSVHTSVAGMRVDSAAAFVAAIPEPSAISLCGLAGLMAFRRRRG